MKKIFCFQFLFLLLISFSGYSQVKSDWANLGKYAEADKNLPAPTANEERVVFMGNSITEFWGKIDSSFFSENPYIDRGISGQVSSQMLLRFRQDVINLKPDIVVILAGTNDIAENQGPISLEDILGNIVSMVQLAKQNNIKVIICSVLPAYDFPWHRGLEPAEKIVKLNDMIRSYCSENNIKYVDYYSRMVDERKGLDSNLTKDGVHPNLAGYKVMEPLVVNAINKMQGKNSQ